MALVMEPPPDMLPRPVDYFSDEYIDDAAWSDDAEYIDDAAWSGDAEWADDAAWSDGRCSADDESYSWYSTEQTSPWVWREVAEDGPWVVSDWCTDPQLYAQPSHASTTARRPDAGVFPLVSRDAHREAQDVQGGVGTTCLVRAVGDVLHDMLCAERGLGLDLADFRRKLHDATRARSRLTLQQVIQLASEEEFRSSDGRSLLALRVEWQELRSFEHVLRTLQLLPDRASMVAMLSDAHAIDVVSVFRTACHDVSRVVGRSFSNPAQCLKTFGRECFLGAVVLHPSVLRSRPAEAGRDFPVGEQAPVQPAVTRHVTARSVAATAAQLKAVMACTEPSVLALRNIRELLLCSLQPGRVLDIAVKLAVWLKRDSAAATRRFIAATDAQGALVEALRRPSGREAQVVLCCVLGRASWRHARNAAAFLMHGAAALLCEQLRGGLSDKELQRHGLYALGRLACAGGARQVAAAQGLDLALQARAMHRGSASVQVNALVLLRSLAADASPQLLDEAARDARRLFPASAEVRKAAEALLAEVAGGLARSVCKSMDLNLQDLAVQTSGVQTLAHLASSGLAWRRSAAAASDRILRAMKTHQASADFQALALWTLRRLVRAVEASPQGMFDAAERARKAHPESPAVQDLARKLSELIDSQ